MATTHLEVIDAKDGAKVYGIESGQILKVDKETPCFFFITAPNGREIKVSKKTGLCCHWGVPSTSAVFNV